MKLNSISNVVPSMYYQKLRQFSYLIKISFHLLQPILYKQATSKIPLQIINLIIGILVINLQEWYKNGMILQGYFSKVLYYVIKNTIIYII